MALLFQTCYSWASISEKSHPYMWSASLGVCLNIFLWYMKHLNNFFFLLMQINLAGDDVTYSTNCSSFPIIFVVSFILWYVSCGLLTVLWALAVGLLGMCAPPIFQVSSLLVLCLFFLVNVFSSPRSDSQPLSFMQVLEPPTWKHVWIHSERNSVLFGEIIVSCSWYHSVGRKWVNLFCKIYSHTRFGHIIVFV